MNNKRYKLIFSKLLSGMWPHFEGVAKRCGTVYSEYKQGHDITKFTTNGTEDKRVEVRKKRTDSPTKNQAATATSSASWKQATSQPAQAATT
jgi:hypothetical protein